MQRCLQKRIRNNFDAGYYVMQNGYVEQSKHTSSKAVKITITKRKFSNMAKIQLTARQTQVLRTMRDLQRSSRKAPTQAQIAETLGIKQHTVSEHITNLALKGAVTKYGRTNRIKFYDITKTKAAA
jgi:DNA-binding CsgD family transcriptional regulator